MMQNTSAIAGSKTGGLMRISGAFGNMSGYLNLMGNVSCAGDYQDSTRQKWKNNVAIAFTLTPDTQSRLTKAIWLAKIFPTALDLALYRPIWLGRPPLILNNAGVDNLFNRLCN
ncbi:hypothetical protein BG74_02665 [Sodalis-like endosymbiont of Proechinophthirus fluctus]|uniref:hypothetical protein n=1 Tax=Sodalis-like endosymbiont of Proechinophthirus fluctus TaxID=1462730 RepID=UPI0007A90659|nr:hypothetical protein [Sodalis-like endosymbiont of Proechinophthirus fluctus]KYP97443.1 hypothetical protein BG74_02665 [Sodalis-like endosymbiont of Proechinophthirus fluctus]